MPSSRLSSSALFAFVLAGCADDPPDDAASIQRGSELYGAYCALCHGEGGEGYAADNANALSNQDFLAIASDALISRGIERGRPGTPMSAWGASRGGPLAADDVTALVAFIRSWQTAPSFDLSQVTVGAGEPVRGEAVYAVYCEDCHGSEGTGGDFMSVGNPEFLASVSDAFVTHVVRAGRGGTEMLAFGSDLTDQNIFDVVALIRSWEKPTDDEPCDPPSQDIADTVINPDGAPPDFPADGPFISVADVFAAYEGGARLRLLDARPPCDYVEEHITGAASVPFYAGDDYLAQLPSDDWIVTYCACPHAEAGALADVLRAGGLTKVKVLDEGLPGWLELGHPTTTGNPP